MSFTSGELCELNLVLELIIFPILHKVKLDIFCWGGTPLAKI